MSALFSYHASSLILFVKQKIEEARHKNTGRGSAHPGGGVLRAEHAAALDVLLLEVVGVDGVVRGEEAPPAPVARDAEQPQQHLLRQVPVRVVHHVPRQLLDPPLLLRPQRRRCLHLIDQLHRLLLLLCRRRDHCHSLVGPRGFSSCGGAR
jgi:hypothetical protein